MKFPFAHYTPGGRFSLRHANGRAHPADVFEDIVQKTFFGSLWNELKPVTRKHESGRLDDAGDGDSQSIPMTGRDLCRCAVRSLVRYLQVVAGTTLEPGIVAVIQTFGDRINFHPICISW